MKLSPVTSPRGQEAGFVVSDSCCGDLLPQSSQQILRGFVVVVVISSNIIRTIGK